MVVVFIIIIIISVTYQVLVLGHIVLLPLSDVPQAHL